MYEFTEYFYDRSKLSRKFTLCFLVAVVFIWGAIALPQMHIFERTGMLLFGALLILGALSFLSKLLTKKSALRVGNAGLILPNFSNELLPWTAISEFKLIESGKIQHISLSIDPAFAASLKKKTIRAVLARLLPRSGSRAAIQLSILAGDPDAIFRRCSEALASAREAAAGDQVFFHSMADEITAPALKGGKPIFTYALIALLVLIYAGELGFGVDAVKNGAPSISSLFLLGATLKSAVVDQGEWWRLFTAPLMHGNLAHLSLNCLSLWLAGAVLERLIGWRWFAATFFLSAFGGSFASVFLNAPNIVGVGASGGIVGLFAAGIAASFHVQSTRISTELRIRAIQILLPSLLPFLANAKNGQKIDYAAHLGGAIVGLVVSLLMLGCWPKTSSFPRFSRAIIAVSVVFLGTAAASLFPILQTREAFFADPMGNYRAQLYKDATDGFALKARQGDKNVAYYYIWQFLSQTHVDKVAALNTLKENSQNLAHSEWPAPVIDVFLSASDIQELPRKAANADQLCESTFYTGEWYRLQNDSERAISQFNQALSSCPHTFMEYEGANAELAHFTANN